MLEAYVWPDGSGPLFLSNWPSLLDRDRIQLAHFLEFNAEHEILPVIREAWMSEYQFLLSSGEGGVGNDYWTLRKAFVVAERLGRLAIHIGESPAPKLRASLEEAEAHFNLLAGSIIRRSAPHSKLLKLMPTTGPSS
ncbi:MAG: hypothetical protein JWN89_338 [Parcubacteria group bacterium]|nr:hypothetical protein [Parcubacteria group bacterium]